MIDLQYKYNTAASDVLIAPSNSKKVTVNLAGSTAVGTIDNSSETASDATIILKSGFSGSAKIKTASTTEGTVVATVETGVDVSGISVEGLDATAYELKVNDSGQLVIAAKAAEPAAGITAAAWETTLGNYTVSGDNSNILTDKTTGEVVYGYKTAGIETAAGASYTKVVASVESADGQTKTVEQSLSGFNPNGSAVTFYIISTKALNTSVSTVTLQ